ncbi:hypothetical protein [Chitinophaga tropicalis]|uniref:Uncharacterized protein n=1 Tax=Chitinophaga tropicalis TaxID=2683588 RepID=A0A7K1U037_9BACT|nr:hypothetical protein [Chitinophaga tropicalis]MVT07734.1 hypothetical protein [Chitinophaga tropicalis]
MDKLKDLIALHIEMLSAKGYDDKTLNNPSNSKLLADFIFAVCERAMVTTATSPSSPLRFEVETYGQPKANMSPAFFRFFHEFDPLNMSIRIYQMEMRLSTVAKTIDIYRHGDIPHSTEAYAELQQQKLTPASQRPKQRPGAPTKGQRRDHTR